MVKKYIFAVFVLFLILVGHSSLPLAILTFGAEIHLRGLPVDPREIYRGDYVNIRTEIDDFYNREFTEAIKAKKQKTTDVFIILRKDETKDDGRFYKPDGISTHRPEGEIYISAVAEYDEKGQTFGYVYTDNLKRFYVPENTGQELEMVLIQRDIEKRRLDLVVKVLYGQAIIDRIDREQK